MRVSDEDISIDEDESEAFAEPARQRRLLDIMGSVLALIWIVALIFGLKLGWINNQVPLWGLLLLLAGSLVAGHFLEPVIDLFGGCC